MPRTESEAEIIFGDLGPPGGADAAMSTVKIGEADLPHGGKHDIEEEGMLIGTSHPIFHPNSNPPESSLHVPPGARFDPISPIGPGFYSPGEPDFDELLPPGGPSDPLGRTVRPPLKPKSGSPSFRAPFGHPHGAPPGSGNPPFFM